MPKTAYVYILASKKNGTLYTGVTSNLKGRMYEHKQHLLEGFTSKYDVMRLVWSGLVWSGLVCAGRGYRLRHRTGEKDQEPKQAMENQPDRES